MESDLQRMEKQGQKNVDLDGLFAKIKHSAQSALVTAKTIASHEAIASGLNSKGISLLEVKNTLMLQYLQNLCLLMNCKLTGQSISGHPAVWRLVVNRTYLEKIQTIESKLKYQIDKLVRKHKFGDTGEQDALKFRPNLDNFGGVSDEDDKSDEEDSEEEKKKKNVYKAPKLAPMHYSGDETAEERISHKMERLKKRALSSTMLEELKRDHMDEPEEIVESRDLHRIRADRKRKERQEYEEEYFVRTSISKKEKNQSKRMVTMSSLDGLLRMDNLSHLDVDANVGEPAGKKKRSSKGKQGKGKKGKGKKKWRRKV